MQYTRNYNFTTGTTIVADQIDQEFDSIRGILNGNIDSDNLKDASVTNAKLVNDSVTANKTEELPKCVNVYTPGGAQVVTDPLMQRGWGYIVCTASPSPYVDVVLPIEYDNEDYDLSVTLLGYKTAGTANPTKRTDFSQAGVENINCATVIDKTKFRVGFHRSDDANHVNGLFLGFSWFTVGKKAR